MFFVPYVVKRTDESLLYVKIDPASEADIAATRKMNWQTDWESDYLSNPAVDKYALKGPDGELIALGAYQVSEKQTFAYIVYLESAPHSNPTMQSSRERKYYGIGEVMIAFGIKYSIDNGCRGVVVFEAKTEELAQHYKTDFHALEISRQSGAGPRRFMLADEDAWRLFSKFLDEEEKL